jgi:5-formyltetrahydrofolate cyclo-ligase
MAERRAGVSAEAGAVAAGKVSRRVLALPELSDLGARAARGRPSCVAGYVAIRGELDPAPVLAAVRGAGGVVVLPRVISTRPPRLHFHRVDSGAELAPGRFGLSEPLASCPEVGVEEIDVMFVPGLAFDAEGRRLGQGGGYYDDAGRRLRAAKHGGVMIGLCHDFQVVERCPVGPEDVAVDVVVTDLRELRGGPRTGAEP